MGATNTWYCLSCKSHQYGSVSAIRPCQYCNYAMSIWHEPGSIPAVPVYVGAAVNHTKTKDQNQDRDLGGGDIEDEKIDGEDVVEKGYSEKGKSKASSVW